MAIRSIKAQHFFDTAFKGFSLYDNVRSIPKITDGLKPAQRKAIYGTLIRGENAGLIQVERLAAQVAASTNYHHGTGSLAGTIVGMANNYPGSNNLNLFVPEGQFGSRLTAEAAAFRYIETKLSDNFRLLFPSDDDAILEHEYNDGEKIEPVTYAPLIPLVLVNGAQGTGTGHACTIMQYNPDDIRDACIRAVDGKKLKPLTPFFSGFSGTVERNPENYQVVITGKLEVINTTTIHVTELPVGVYLDQFKARLHKLEDRGFVKDYEDRSTEQGFDFTIIVPRTTTALPLEDLYRHFGIISRDTENFTLWDIHGNLKKYSSPEEIISEFVPWRISIMEKRKAYQLQTLTEQIRFTSETIRFIQFYLDNVSVFRNTSKKELISLLEKNGFVDYERLLSMSIWSLTRDKISELEDRHTSFQTKLSELKTVTPEDMYKKELKALKFE